MRLINPFSLNLITLALLGAGTSAFAADFGVQNANIAEGKTANFQSRKYCLGCTRKHP